tara:strand:- start:1966 stop:2094 length:129 start_codon:yes stop_codon:yes gene_type:complete
MKKEPKNAKRDAMISPTISEDTVRIQLKNIKFEATPKIIETT